MSEPSNEQPPNEPTRTPVAGGAPNQQRARRIARRQPGEDATAEVSEPAARPAPSAPDPGPRIAPARSPVVRVARTVDVNLGEHTHADGPATNRVTGWLYQKEDVAQHAAKPWYQVLCLTGVDYFSTLGYQPGIAYLAAGLLAPVATLILVLFTLAAALPTYNRIAAESPHGQGSIGMLERLLPRWRGKLFVLVLLGFAATDFIITITLSAADATAHVVENPFVPHSLAGNISADIAITLLFIAALGAIFLKGFKEAIGIAVVLVVIYLGLNLVVIVRALGEVGGHPDLISAWLDQLRAERGNPLTMVAVSLILFPKLALGLSGFETGVAVMPVIQGDPGDTDEQPSGRIRNTRKLLVTSAAVMSLYLLASSLATTILIPKEAFAEGGGANGRALAFLAHEYLGEFFGTAYDLSTIAILWFAGASAMAGLLNLVPRYLPGYGMAPKWAAAQRPLVLVFIIIAVLVTILFRADVNAQGSAYATGVLVLMTSGSVAVTISLWRKQSRLKWAFILILLAFIYITVQNIHERPNGLVIASFFILSIVLTSIVSRVLRSTELRIDHVVLDRSATQMIQATLRGGAIGLVTHDPVRGCEPEDYERELVEARRRHNIAPETPLLMLEVRNDDPSVFLGELRVTGHMEGPYRLLRCDGAAIANTIAALAIAIHGQYECDVHLYMRWTPIDSVLDAVGEGIQFLLWGGGDMARLAEMEVRREALDQAIIVHAA